MSQVKFFLGKKISLSQIIQNVKFSEKCKKNSAEAGAFRRYGQIHRQTAINETAMPNLKSEKSSFLVGM